MSVSSIAQYILDISAVSATGFIRNLINTLIKGGCTVGPTKSVSLKETPVEDFAEAPCKQRAVGDKM